MSRSKTIITALAFALIPIFPASALCIYNGQMYAKTTLPQEFSDAKWVVKVRVIAADDHWSDEDESWTIYHLRTRAVFKGQPPSDLALFTYRDSGGFFLDKGMNADLGGEYLLFLDPISRNLNVPPAARRATEVNYNCGQSKAWADVSDAEQKQLARLSGETRNREQPAFRRRQDPN